MSSANVVRATDLVAAAAAEDALLSGASALRAVAAGYLAAAGEYPGVLLASASILVAGFGALRAVDGRLRQPGLGERRPRGWLDAGAAPDVARLAAPANLAALFVALTYDEDRRNSVVFRAGVSRARAAGAKQRAALIEQLADRGGNAWTEPALHRPLLHLAGPSEGGLLGRKDFDLQGANLDFAATRQGETLSVPWSTVSVDGTEGCSLEAIAAIDHRGNGAAIVYERCNEGIEVNELELIAPRAAALVLRGEPRVRPGTPLAMPCPLEMRLLGNTVLEIGVREPAQLRVAAG